MDIFKKHCRNRNFYMAQVYVIDEEIKHVDILMSKPRSPRLEVIGAPAHDHESHIVDWIDRKRILEEERNGYLKLVEMIDQIKQLPKPWNDIYWRSLVCGESVRTLCKEFNISKDKYYRMLAKFTPLIMIERGI